MTEIIQKRYDFVLLFDVRDGNPNGDPDAGNLPRVDPETGHGLVTDVCLKRKLRNYVALARDCRRPYDIYVKEKAVLGQAHSQAFESLGISLGKDARQAVPEDLKEPLQEVQWPDGLSLVSGSEDDTLDLIIGAGIDKNEIQDWLKTADLDAKSAKFVKGVLKSAKPRKPRAEEVSQGRRRMCEWFYDIRTFGAVMSLKSAPNCGQVRGPVQLTFARSLHPVVPLEHSITRMAVATEAEAEKQGGDNRTMGRKHTIPYGLYRAHGFVSAHLARQTGFSKTDLDLLWEGLTAMFEHDRSAARGQMATRGLYVFEHDSALGNAPAHQLFERIQVRCRTSPPRGFEDMAVVVDDDGLPDGVRLLRKLE